MMVPEGFIKVFVALEPVDFRKGHDGLVAITQQVLGLDPFCGAAFVFRSKRADRIKVLIWDGTGLVLMHKRLAAQSSTPKRSAINSASRSSGSSW